MAQCHERIRPFEAEHVTDGLAFTRRLPGDELFFQIGAGADRNEFAAIFHRAQYQASWPWRLRPGLFLRKPARQRGLPG